MDDDPKTELPTGHHQPIAVQLQADARPICEVS